MKKKTRILVPFFFASFIVGFAMALPDKPKDNAVKYEAAGPVPYNITARRMPAGTDFNTILPAYVGAFKRTGYKAPQPGLDGEAIYRFGKKEIFMLFSISETRKDLKEIMETIHTEIKEAKTTDDRIISLKSDPAYIKFTGPTIAFFAWTRGLYCFSADSKGGDKKTLDQFMQAFPY
jgi:hypothetical protein